MMPKPLRHVFLFAFLFCGITLFAQDSGMEIKVTPEKLTLQVGEKAQLMVTVLDETGNAVADPELRFFSRKGRCAEVDETGTVTAHEPGEASIIVIYPLEAKFLRADIAVQVAYPPLSRIEIVDAPEYIYTGIPTSIHTRVLDEMDLERKNVTLSFSTDDTGVATFDSFNHLTAHRPGRVTITVATGDIRTQHTVEIRENPVAELAIASTVSEALTGDVIPFTVRAYNADGKEVTDVPVSYSFTGRSDDVMAFASGLIREDGRFVAYQSGMYRITATCGDVATHQTVRITPRQELISRPIELVGRGAVTDKHTSDLWVWEGLDGRDYAVTGTWGADGEAFFWDVTDPAGIKAIDTVKVDARTVNDVKISEDGRICVISREGASNRKNGIFILDVTNPRDVKVLSEFTEGLTGGVHNLYIYKNHVYALSNGERYDIINIEDPANPRKVGTFELDTPGHAIHDVWIHDGIAYSSNWHDGVRVVDVGNGKAGGTPDNPVEIGHYAYPSGWNHAAFPYFDKASGKFYIIGGDEAFPNGLYIEDKPTIPAGWLHIIDFTDPDNPEEVAKYEVPGAGSHNFWVENDILYVGNYNGGLRVVDLSGELLGDLYRQGREIGWFMPTDPKGVVPNAAMTWGAQPHKGHIFFSDWNSGLWSVKLKDKPLEN